MLVRAWRWLIFAVVAVPFGAVFAGAQPPPPLLPPKPAVDETPASIERAKLQAELLSLLRRINTAPAPVPPPITPAPKTKIEPSDAAKVDAIREGVNLFRDNNFEAARRTFQLIDATTLSPEDRVFVRYMLACCLRRLGRVGEAEVIYREVANTPTDEFLANCAMWQLSLIRSELELQAQLAQLRARVKSK